MSMKGSQRKAGINLWNRAHLTAAFFGVCEEFANRKGSDIVVTLVDLATWESTNELDSDERFAVLNNAIDTALLWLDAYARGPVATQDDAVITGIFRNNLKIKMAEQVRAAIHSVHSNVA